MKLRVIVIQCAILCVWLAGGRAYAADSDRASLAGRVVKEPGGEPLKKALVELIGESAGESGHNYTATSDADGNVSIPNIVPGRYHLLVERTGYLFVDAKHRRTETEALSFEKGQALTDQVFHMLPCAVITGRVVDEDGDPMPDAFVSVLHRTSNEKLDQMAAERTNDVGQYRISGIMPGRYYVSVTPPPDLASLLSSRKKDPRPDLAYVPTFYPNAIDHAQASPIELRAGDEVPIDFALTRTQTARIRGTVVTAGAGAHAEVALRSTDGNLMFNNVEVDKDGKFEMRDVAPGTYELLAIETRDEERRMARQTEQVAGANVDGVRLTPVPGATVQGRVRVDGPPVDLSQFAFTLHPAEQDNWMTIVSTMGSGRVHADGTFEWKDLAPGLYTLEALSERSSGADYFLESVSAGGREVRDSGLNISGGTVFLDVVLSPKGANLSGAVVDDKGQPVANAVVLAMPEEKFRKRSERYAKATTDQRGQFSMRGLIPGQYFLLAWESLDGDSYLDPDFRKPYEDQVVAVTAEKAGQSQVSLKVLPAPEN
jgi:protocatechuate 3,4-dioxygenase beta subunit